MAHSPRPADTTPETSAVLADRWRTMTVAERVASLRQMCAEVDRLARAGIAATRPELTGRAIEQELVRRRYGRRLADAAYADFGR